MTQTTETKARTGRRLLGLAAGAALLAVLGGCVVYPAGYAYAPAPHHYYWHGYNGWR